MPKVERPLKSAGWRKLKVPFQRARWMGSHGAVALLSRGGREPRFQTNPVFIRQTFFPGCRCLENFSIRNLVNRYPDVSRIVRVFRGFFHRGIIHFIPWTTKDSRERCFWKKRERENEERQLWKTENDSGNLDFRIGTTWLSSRAGRRRRIFGRILDLCRI